MEVIALMFKIFIVTFCIAYLTQGLFSGIGNMFNKTVIDKQNEIIKLQKNNTSNEELKDEIEELKKTITELENKQGE